MRTTLETPQESRSSLPSRQVAGLIAAVLALVLAANLAVVALVDRYRAQGSMERAVVSEKWAHLAEAAEPYDIVLVGDSSGLMGVDPEVIAQRTGLRCYNACAFGQLLLVNEAWLLQHLESLGRVPPIVVSIHVHDLFAREADMVRRRLGDFPADVRPWERYEPRLAPADRRIRERIYEWFPLIRSPKETRLALASLWTGSRPGDGARDRLSALGLSRLPRLDPEGLARDIEEHLAELAGSGADRPALSAVNRAAFERLVEVLDRHGSSLIVAEAPTAARLAASPLYSARLERNAEALRKLAAGRAGFLHAPTGRDGFADAVMQNADHLADEAARLAFSNRIADVVAQVVAARRADVEAAPRP